MRAAALTAFVVGLALLVAGALYWGPGRVERDLEVRAAAALTASVPNAPGVTLAADGRVLQLGGTVADEGVRAAVVAAARGVRGVDAVDDALELAPTTTTAVPTTAPSPTLDLGSLRAVVSGGRVRLQGAIPNQAVRVELVRRLLKRYGPLLADELQFGGAAPADLVQPFGRLVERGALSLSDGSFVLSDRTLVLMGTTASDATPASLVALAKRTTGGWTVVDSLRPATPRTTVPTSVATSESQSSGTVAPPPAPADWQGRVDELLRSAPVPLDPSAKELPAVAGLVLEQVAQLVVAAEPAAVEVVVREPPLPRQPLPEDPDEAERAQAERATQETQARTRTARQAALVVQALRDRGVTDVPLAATGAGAVAPAPGDPGLRVRVVVRFPPPPTTVPDTTVASSSRKRSSVSNRSSR